jgi:hypothetical protein
MAGMWQIMPANDVLHISVFSCKSQPSGYIRPNAVCKKWGNIKWQKRGVVMKTWKRVGMEPGNKSISSWRNCVLALLSLALLPGLLPATESRVDHDIPELPGFEVRGFWASHNLTPPVALKVVTPTVGDRLVGTNVRMTFILDTDGKAKRIRHDGNMFEPAKTNLGAIMTSVLESWEFEPPRDGEGAAVRVKVALPVMVVAKGEPSNADVYARLAFKEPVILAVLDR